MTRRLHAAGKRDSEGGEEGGEKESSKAARLLGLRHGRRVRRRPGKIPKDPDWEITTTPMVSYTYVGMTIFVYD